jgi:PAS domain S-box-containing protein
MKAKNSNKNGDSYQPDNATDPNSGDLCHAALESVELAIHVVDSGLKIVVFNAAFRRWCRELGIDIEREVGRTVFEIFPFLPPKVRNEYRQVFQTGKTLSTEEETVINGRDIVTETRKLPIFSGKKASHVITVMRDITEQRQAEKALRESEEKYRSQYQSIPVPTYTWEHIGNDFRFVEYNQAAEIMTEGKLSDYIGKKAGEMYAHMPDVIKDMNRCLADKATITREMPYRFMSTTQERYLIVKYAYVPQDLVLVHVEDITERKNTEERLKETIALLQSIMDSSSEGIIIATDAAGIVLVWNEGARRILGYEPQEVVGKKSVRIFHTKDYLKSGVMETNIENMITTGKPSVGEITYVAKDGRSFPVWQVVSPRFDEDGEFIGMLGIAYEITERKLAEDALRRSEERFRAIFETAQDSIFIKDKNLRYIQVNPAVEKLFDLKASELLGRDDVELFGEDIAKSIAEVDLRVLAGEVVEEEPVKPVKGTPKTFHVVKAPMRDEFGKIIGICGISRDITERKLAEEALREARDELETRIGDRTRELAETNEELRVEQEALQQKNIALQEILNQIEAGKRQMASQIQSNVDRIILPILDTLEGKISQSGKHYISLLRSSLTEITSPFIDSLETRFSKFTPREVEVCNMVKNGLTCKDIANTLNISVQTVLKQRAIIRKKLGISNKKVNLSSHLMSLK